MKYEVIKPYDTGIPLFAVTGTNGKTSTARLLYYLLSKLGFYAGLACTGSITIGDEIVEEGDTTGFLSSRRILMDSTVEAAVFETARGGIVNNGLGFENIDVAIITSLSEDHLGIDNINTLEELGEVKSVVLEEVKSGGKWILKAQPELVAIAKKYRKIDVEVCLFGLSKNTFIENHIKNNHEAFYVEEDYIIQNLKGVENRLVNIKELPFTHYGISSSNILNVMSCLAALSTIEPNLKKVSELLKYIPCDIKYNPGRQNILSYDKFKLLLDYGHNKEAYEEVFSIVRALKPSIVTSIITAPGDRNNKHLEELGYLAGLESSKVIIREQANQRGSELGRVASLLKVGALRAGLQENQIFNINDASEALKFAMEKAQQMETIVLFIEDLSRIIKVL
jgi:UDP-N-acetylmuramyl tripeptide synthase